MLRQRLHWLRSPGERHLSLARLERVEADLNRKGIPNSGELRFTILAGEGGQYGMPRAYSDDLRERVAAAASKRTCHEVASVVKWSQRLRATGSAAAKLQGSLPGRSRLLPHRNWLLERIKAPGMTMRRLPLHACLNPNNVTAASSRSRTCP